MARRNRNRRPSDAEEASSEASAPPAESAPPADFQAPPVAAPEPPKVQVYKVTKDTRFMTSVGGITWMKAGQRISARTHDLEDVKRQKVPFEPVPS